MLQSFKILLDKTKLFFILLYVLILFIQAIHFVFNPSTNVNPMNYSSDLLTRIGGSSGQSLFYGKTDHITVSSCINIIGTNTSGQSIKLYQDQGCLPKRIRGHLLADGLYYSNVSHYIRNYFSTKRQDKANFLLKRIFEYYCQDKNVVLIYYEWSKLIEWKGRRSFYIFFNSKYDCSSEKLKVIE